MNSPAPSTPRRIDAQDAATFLLNHLALRGSVPSAGGAGVAATLQHLGCFQLDPLDRIGTNADLVAMARVDDLKKGEVYTHAFAAGAFEHFAKERCILPARLFSAWRDRAVETPWWRLGEQSRKLSSSVLEAVLAEVRERGPLAARDLSDHGRVEPTDWSGWKGTSKAATQALQVLWTRCQVVVAARAPNGDRIYDVPERALGAAATAPAPEHFETFALLARVRSMGLMPRASGPWWSVLNEARKTDLPERLVAEGQLVSVQVPGRRATYLAPPDLVAAIEAAHAAPDDGRMRVLGPLDPLLWCRPLVHQIFGFDYVWEVYKPESTRKFGYYVCPLLHRGRLVGRVEARVSDGSLVVERLWTEGPAALEADAVVACLHRHAASLGVHPPTPATLHRRVAQALRPS
jgi:hypothetical protein